MTISSVSNNTTKAQERPEEYGRYHVKVDENNDGTIDRIDEYSYSNYNKEKPMERSGSFYDTDQNGIFDLYKLNEQGVAKGSNYTEAYTCNQTIVFDNTTGKALMSNHEYYGNDYGEYPGQYYNVETAKFEGNKITITNLTSCPEGWFNNDNGTDVFELSENGEIIWNGEVHEMWPGYEDATPEEKLSLYMGEFFGTTTYPYNQTAEDLLKNSKEITQAEVEAWSKPIEENQAQPEEEPSTTEEQVTEKTGNFITNALKSIGDFFKGLFN